MNYGVYLIKGKKSNLVVNGHFHFLILEISTFLKLGMFLQSIDFNQALKIFQKIHSINFSQNRYFQKISYLDFNEVC